MTLQMEGDERPAEGIRCLTCDGHGSVPTANPRVDGALPCRACDETGVRSCERCNAGDEAVSVNDGEAVCESCLDEAENGPSGDHPMMGMGYGIDYSEQLAAARLLK